MWVQQGRTWQIGPDVEYHPSPGMPSAGNENSVDIGEPRPLRRFGFRIIRPAVTLHPSRTQLFRAAIGEERDHGRLMLFSPVACGAGAICWFHSPVQPSPGYMTTLLVISGLLFLTLRFRNALASVFVAAMALALAGAALAAYETARTATILLDKPVTTTIAGVVLAREPGGRGLWRYEVALTQTAKPKLRRAPATVTVFGRSVEPAGIGDLIEGRVRLSPPSGPALPGLTDFAFQAYYNGIGATGFFYGRPVIRTPGEGAAAPPLVSWFHKWRAGIGDHIRSVIGGDEGAFAAALVTNEQRAISPDTMEALRLSGLAHIIAISGMNMALAAGLSFIGLRSLLVLSVGLGQGLPVKKIAATGAIIAVTIYYTISGFAVSAERAYIMMVIMLVAVLFDRPAISMRNIALSAWVILITSPDALMGASFQMSYAGTLGLVAGYEVWARRQTSTRHPGLPMPRYVRTAMTFMAGATVTSAIGGSATALFSLVHFQRLASYGLVANVLVTPLLSLLVMPMLMLAMVLMPLGLDTYPLLIMGWGLKWIIAIGVQVSSWDGQWLPGMLPAWSFASASLGLLVLALLRTRLRLAGLALLCVASLLVVTLPGPPKPDFILSEDGALAAFVDTDALAANQPKPSDFLFGQWQRALRSTDFIKPRLLAEPHDVRHDAREDRYRPLTDGEEIAERIFLDTALAGLQPGQFVCKKGAWCAARYGKAGILLVIENRVYTGLACDMASMVIADPSPRFTACRSGALLISHETLRRTGSLAFHFTKDPARPRITASFNSISRPWQAFRAYDWRSGAEMPDLPSHVLSLMGDASSAANTAGRQLPAGLDQVADINDSGE